MPVVHLRDRVKAAIAEAMDGLAETLVNGAVSDMGTYKHITGQLYGLRKALEMLDCETNRLLGAGGDPETESRHAGIYDP
jgi:hypothetical protein